MSTKSTTACWNGNSGSTGDIKGSLGWDGAIVLQIRHWALVCLALAPNQGQNNRCLAFASLPFMLWCAEWRNSSTSARSCRDMRLSLPLIDTPSRHGRRRPFSFYSWRFIETHDPENTSYGWEVIAWLGKAILYKICKGLAFFVCTHRSYDPFQCYSLQPRVAFVHRRRGLFNSSVDRLGWVNRNCLKGLMYRILLRLSCWRVIIFPRVLRWGTCWVSGSAIGCRIEFSGTVFNPEFVH